MAKTKTVYVCTSCGNDSPKWQGKCPACGEWIHMVRRNIAKENNKKTISGFDTPKSKPLRLQEVETSEELSWI